MFLQFASDHPGDELAHVEIGRALCADTPPIAQHGDVIGEAADFL
jgi:hypothetical protein